jgi:5-methylthioribose kinase
MTEHVDSFKDVFQKLWKECTQEQQVNFAMTAKILWRRRNTKLWENKNELVEDVISQASNVFHTSKRAEQSVTYSNNKCIVHYTT